MYEYLASLRFIDLKKKNNFPPGRPTPQPSPYNPTKQHHIQLNGNNGTTLPSVTATPPPSMAHGNNVNNPAGKAELTAKCNNIVKQTSASGSVTSGLTTGGISRGIARAIDSPDESDEDVDAMRQVRERSH